MTKIKNKIAIIIFILLASTRLFGQARSEFGLASWYGTQFQGRPTASGEPFNMYDLTCAHRTLPFGTVLQVINLKNNLSVQVRVNDRGPGVASRVIDLSYQAAKNLDMIKDGVVQVKLDVLGMNQPYNYNSNPYPNAYQPNPNTVQPYSNNYPPNPNAVQPYPYNNQPQPYYNNQTQPYNNNTYTTPYVSPQPNTDPYTLNNLPDRVYTENYYGNPQPNYNYNYNYSSPSTYNPYQQQPYLAPENYSYQYYPYSYNYGNPYPDPQYNQNYSQPPNHHLFNAGVRIQYGAFKVINNTFQEVFKLGSIGIRALVIQQPMDSLIRVVSAETYSSAASAEAATKGLKKRGVPCLVRYFNNATVLAPYVNNQPYQPNPAYNQPPAYSNPAPQAYPNNYGNQGDQGLDTYLRSNSGVVDQPVPYSTGNTTNDNRNRVNEIE